MDQRSRNVADHLRRISRRPRTALAAASVSERQDFAALAASPQEARHVAEGLAAVERGENPTEEQRLVLEAIVLPAQRPVIDIRDDTFDDFPPFWTQLEHFKPMLDRLIPSIGRIESRSAAPYEGTGFLVGPDLVMTNRHVADNFVRGLGAPEVLFKTRFRPRVDLKREIQGRQRVRLKVLGSPLVHPYWDMALLEVEGVPEDREPLRLMSRPPAQPDDREVAVIGYPYRDSRNPDMELQNRIFRNRYGVKRLQPGLTAGAESIVSFGHTVRALTHDASTLGGNSGSAVIDLETGEVIGLHFGGIYLRANYAVPAWELARDVRVRKTRVFFTEGEPGEPDPEVEAAWEELGASGETPAGEGVADPGPASVRPTPEP